jgi:hypothetical protein
VSKAGGRTCECCGNGGASGREHSIVACDACWSSPFKRGRLVERATGVPQACDCGGDCAANQRAKQLKEAINER